MKMSPASGAMTWLFWALAFALPSLIVGGGLRGLLLKSPSALQPLQRPPPAIADAVLAQMAAVPAPAPASSPASGPAPGPAPSPAELTIPKITEATCEMLTGKVAQLIGAAGAPAPAPAAALLEVGEDAPAPAGADKPTVECKAYAYVAGKGAGCSCFVEAPPPPFVPKVAGCPEIKDALYGMGFTGGVLALGPMAFGGQTGGWTRHTCIYRQWFFDPAAKGAAMAYQTKLNDARATKYITDTYAAALNNAHNTASAYWALTPVPWLKLYPTTPWPMQAGGPAPGPAPAPGPQTTPYIFAPSLTTPAPMFGFGTTPMAGMGVGPTTAPTYAVVR